MPLFISYRQRLLNRFEASGEGCLYRNTFWSRAIYVSKEEQEWMVSGLERHRSDAWMILIPALIVATVICAMGSMIPGLNNYLPAVFLLSVLLQGVIFDRYSKRSLKKFLRSQPYVTDRLPMREINRRLRSDMSWSSVIWFLFLCAAQIKNYTDDKSEGKSVSALIVTVTVLVFTVWMACLKIRDNASEKKLSD